MSCFELLKCWTCGRASTSGPGMKFVCANEQCTRNAWVDPMNRKAVAAFMKKAKAQAEKTRLLELDDTVGDALRAVPETAYGTKCRTKRPKNASALMYVEGGDGGVAKLMYVEDGDGGVAWLPDQYGLDVRLQTAPGDARPVRLGPDSECARTLLRACYARAVCVWP